MTIERIILAVAGTAILLSLGLGYWEPFAANERKSVAISSLSSTMLNLNCIDLRPFALICG